jgi:hypothetical protein
MQQNNDRPTALNCVEDAVSIVLGVRHGSTVAQSGKVRNGSEAVMGGDAESGPCGPTAERTFRTAATGGERTRMEQARAGLQGGNSL